MRRLRFSLPPLLLLLAAVPFAGACGSRASTPAAAPGDQSQTLSGSPLAEIATDNVFSQDSYTISTGQSYVLTLTNKGQAIHNWHVEGVKQANGKEIATQLIEGGKSSSIAFSISKPGVYHFQCDVHPDTMKGTLTVQ